MSNLIVHNRNIDDTSSYSNTKQVRQTELNVHLNLDFNLNRLTGYVILSFDVLLQTDMIVLDTRDINVYQILNMRSGKALEFIFDIIYEKTIGCGLAIQLERTYTKGEKVVIQIFYKTKSNPDATFWVKAEKTGTKKMPFVFTECQTIGMRSIVPCQDTPSIKMRVKAELTAPVEYEVLFGGKKIKVLNNENQTRTHVFEQTIPIPSYLFAFAAGEIVGRSIDYPYSEGISIKVWSELDIIDCAYKSFESTLPLYIKTAGEYMFEYEWGSYDILILPRAFPIEGMENPNLTFASRFLLHCTYDDEGKVKDIDMSQLYLAAHELSHSWTGNLVTNGNWNNFWMNEGFTVFMERKIMEKLIDFDYRKLEAEQLYYDLIDDIKMLKNQDRLDYTKLNLYVGRENPDDSFSEVPYSKGYALLHYLEQTVLENENDFQKILKKYIIKYKYSSVIYTDFIEVFMSEIEELYNEDKEKLERVKSLLKFEEWVNEIDIPKLIVNDYSNKYSDEYKKEFEYLKKNKSFNIDFVETFTKKWTSVQREGFLVMMKFDDSVVDDNIIDFIRNTLDLKNKDKYPINTRFRWLQIELNRNSTVGYEMELSEFLDEIGITSIVRELYQRWMEFNKTEAYEEFKKHLDVYNSNTVRLIEEDFNN